MPVWKERESPWTASPPSIDLHGVSVMLNVACRYYSLYLTCSPRKVDSHSYHTGPLEPKKTSSYPLGALFNIMLWQTCSNLNNTLINITAMHFDNILLIEKRTSFRPFLLVFFVVKRDQHMFKCKLNSSVEILYSVRT